MFFYIIRQIFAQIFFNLYTIFITIVKYVYNKKRYAHEVYHFAILNENYIKLTKFYLYCS